MDTFKALLHEGWSAPISFLRSAAPRSAGQHGGRAGSTLPRGGIRSSTWPRGRTRGRGCEERDTQTKESLHFKGLGLQRCCKTEMCSGFRDGGRALTLLCS